MRRQSLAQEIVRLVEEKLTTDEIATRLRCSQTYVRAVKSRMRTGEIDVLLEYEDRSRRREERFDPVSAGHRDRAARLFRAGFSPWEIRQLLPDAVLR